MTCPNCGAPIKEGQLYCEHCGLEIRIVPEFEPEIENSMQSALENVADQIGTGETGPQLSTDDSAPMGGSSPSAPGENVPVGKGHARRVPAGRRTLLLVCVFVAAIGGSLLAYGLIRNNRPDCSFQRGTALFQEGRFADALPRYQRAVELAPSNVTYLNGLAACCFALGDLDGAKEYSRQVVALDSSNEEAWGRIVTVCDSRGEYEELNHLLLEGGSANILARFAEYVALPPSFEPAGGTYHEKIAVRLISSAGGEIHYTMDGTAPDGDSPLYTMPISLESGEYAIRAVCRNRYGVVGEENVSQYLIDVSVPPAPAVEPDSGEFQEPGVITVEVPEGCAVYYTTDGTAPDAGDAQYTEPIPMPAGYTRFQFAACGPGGVMGEITDRSYHLSLHAALGMEAACNLLLLRLIDAGEILNLRGDLPDKSGHNLYTYKYPVAVNGHFYYLYREYYAEPSGDSSMTGNDYVVNYMSGECYQAVWTEGEDGAGYTLLTIGGSTESTADAGQAERREE